MPTREQFLADAQGRQFVAVLKDPWIDFETEVLYFFADPERQRQMEEAQRAGHPALAGVVKEWEARPAVHRFFSRHDAHETMRIRQAVGVTVKIVMENRGWSRTGRKGSLGRRATVAAGTTTPGAYHNVSGPSRWFVRAEHYAEAPSPDAGVPQHGDHAEPREYASRLRAGLDEVASIGTDQERKETLEHLLNSLGAERRREGRPF